MSSLVTKHFILMRRVVGDNVRAWIFQSNSSDSITVMTQFIESRSVRCNYFKLRHAF